MDSQVPTRVLESVPVAARERKGWCVAVWCWVGFVVRRWAVRDWGVGMVIDGDGEVCVVVRVAWGSGGLDGLFVMVAVLGY